MEIEEHYMIEARPELAARLAGRVDAGFAELLMEPVQLVHPRFDRSVLRLDHHHETVVKIVFLASLRQYEELKSDRECEAVFGSPRINAGLFDRWWTLRKLHGPDDTTDGLQEFIVAHFSSVDRTGDEAIDRWLDWVSHHGKRPSPEA